MTSQKYAFAVLDGNEAPDQWRFAQSCHRTLAGARAECSRANARNPNNHYYVVEWDAGRWARERPNDAHYGAREGLLAAQIKTARAALDTFLLATEGRRGK